MATILVKGLREDVLRQLQRLKVELGCRTWAELLERLASSKELVVVDEAQLRRMRTAAQGFLNLRPAVARRWHGTPSVLQEVRKARGHTRG